MGRSAPSVPIHRKQEEEVLPTQWQGETAQVQTEKCNKSWIPAYCLSQQLSAFASTSPKYSSAIRFDSDSYPVLIDNCCTACITICLSDFCDTPRSMKSSISGIGGPIGITLQGTLKWTILDDMGCPHTFRIPNAYYAPNAPHRLFSPQHWSQTAFKNKTLTGWATTYHNWVVLHWNNDTCHRKIPLDNQTNVAKLFTAPGTKHFQGYETLMWLQITNSIHVCFNVQLVPSDDNDLTLHRSSSPISARKGEALWESHKWK